MPFQEIPMPGKGLNHNLAIHRRVLQELRFWWGLSDQDIFNGVYREIPEEVKHECLKLGRDIKRDIWHSIYTGRRHLAKLNGHKLPDGQTLIDTHTTSKPRLTSVNLGRSILCGR